MQATTDTAAGSVLTVDFDLMGQVAGQIDSSNEDIRAMLAVVEKSPIIEELVEHGHLKIVLAKYLQSTGEAVFF